MAETPKKTPKHHIDTNNLFVYLQTGRYLPGTSENSKRNLRKRAKSFKIIEEKLYYVSSHTDNQGNVIEAERLVLREKEEQSAIVAQLHVDEKGCHLGREKLTGKISEKYYFLGISTMVRQYISECAYCQVHRPSHKSSSDGNLSGSAYSDTGDGEDSENSSSFSTSSVEDTKPLANEWMMTMPDPHRFWEIVEMNVMGPYDCDNSQYYIIVFLDIFSKWPEAFLVDNLSPSVVTHLILNLVCRFGCMKTLTLKQCTAFAMEEMHPREDILQKANLEITVNHQKSTLPCPIWSEIKGSIQQFTENNSHWPYCLEFALLPHRISRAESCEYTPSYITYGRELNLPQSLSHKEEDSSSSMFHAAEPHLTSDQMSVTQENLLQAYNMYGKFSEWNQTLNKMTKPLYPSSTSGQTKNSNSKSTVGSSSKRKRKSTFNAENIYYSYDSDDVSEKEIEEDMPPPVSTAGSKEVLTGASKRKRSKQVRLVAQDSNEEDGTIDGNKAQDDPKDVNYASGEKADLDKYYASIYLYKTDRKYVPGSSEAFKRVIRKSSLSYDVQDGGLSYKTAEGYKIVPMTWNERFQLLQKAHIDENGKHVSKGTMIANLQKYTWKCLHNDCTAFTQACPQCTQGAPVTEQPDDRSCEKEEQTAMYAEEHYSLLLFYLQKGRFPAKTSGVAIEKVSKIANNFVLQNGTLYYKKNKASKGRCVEVTARHRKQAIKDAHEPTSGQHSGHRDTLDRLREQYFWYKMKESVSAYILKCCNLESNFTDPPSTSRGSPLIRSVKFFKEYFRSRDSEAVNERSTDPSGQQNNTKISEDGSGIPDNNKRGERSRKTESRVKEVSRVSKGMEISGERSGDSVGLSDSKRLSQSESPNKSMINRSSASTNLSSNREVTSTATETSPGEIEFPQSDESEVSSSCSVPSDSNNVEAIQGGVEDLLSSSSEQTSRVPSSDQSIMANHSTSGQSKIATSAVVNTSTSTDQVERGSATPPNLSCKTAFNDEVTANRTPPGVAKPVTSPDPLTASAVLSILSAEERSVIEKDIQKHLREPTNSGEGTSPTKDSNGATQKQAPPDKDKKMDIQVATVIKTAKNYKPTEGKSRPVYFKCEICGMIIRGKAKYNAHMYKHTGVKPFECDVCHKKFKQINSMRIHKRRHSGYFSFLCSICGKGFTTSCGLRSHTKLHEMGRVVKAMCEICNRQFATINRYERHMKFKHPAKIEIFSCEPCNKVFTTKRSLKRHEMSYHQGIRYHTCDVCGKSFFRKEYLTSHLTQHTSAANNNRSARRMKPLKIPTEQQTQNNNQTTETVMLGPMKNECYTIHEGVTIPRIEYSDNSVGKDKHPKILTDSHSQIQEGEQPTETILISTVNNEFYTIGGTPVSTVEYDTHSVEKTKQQNLQTESESQIQETAIASETILIGPVDNEFYAIDQVTQASTIGPDGRVENAYYTITSSADGEEESPATVVYGYPTVQYEVECGTGTEQVDAEALSAIRSFVTGTDH